jgi:lauroyl/myristoyl acyltransferase
MELTRKIRKKTTVNLLRFGQYLASRGSYRTVERLRTVMRLFFRTCLPLRFRLRTNIRCAGLNPDGLVDAYFERGIDQMLMLAHGFRADFDIASLLEQFRFDETFGVIEQAYKHQKGVIIIAPHLSGYPAFGSVFSSRIPLTIYSRHSQDKWKTKITDTIAKIGNVERIYPPLDATKAQRLQIAMNALRQGKILFITPDTPRKPQEGTPVRILGKRAYFPDGVFVMAMRTGAQVIPAWWHFQDSQYHIRFGNPIQLPQTGKIRDKAQAGVQLWAEQVDAFLRKYPEMWWNWLDKRWTKILRQDSF